MNGIMNIMSQRQDSKMMDKKRLWIVGIILLFILLALSFGFFSKTAMAQRNVERTKLVTSVEVKKGDTLWSIASVYITDEYNDINDYIDELRASNGLTSDTIHAGSYIIVPYYADAS